MRLIFRLLAAPAAVLALVACAPDAATEPGEAPARPQEAAAWTARAPLPAALQEIYADTRGSLVYVAGGYTAERQPSDTFFSYDADRDAWTSLARVPQARHHLTNTVIGDRLYGVGGFSGGQLDWQAQSDVFVYDFQTSSWSAGPALEQARGEHVAEGVGGRVIVSGGRVRGTPEADHYDDHRDTARTDALDPATGRWTRLRDAPTARNSAASTVIDDVVYVVGGRQYQLQPDGARINVNVATLESYDPATDRWTTLAPMPRAQGGLSAAAFGGRLYAFGGEQWTPNQIVIADAWVYDPATDRWSPLPDLITPRHGTAAAATENAVLLLGGSVRTGAAAVATVEALSPAR